MKTKNINIFSAKYIVPLIALLVLGSTVGYIEYRKSQTKKLFLTKVMEYSKTDNVLTKTALEAELTNLWANKGLAKESSAIIPSGAFVSYLNMVLDFCESWTNAQYFAAGSQWVAIEDPFYYCMDHSVSLMLQNTAE